MLITLCNFLHSGRALYNVNVKVGSENEIQFIYYRKFTIHWLTHKNIFVIRYKVYIRIVELGNRRVIQDGRGGYIWYWEEHTVETH